ncbi:MAG: helix-turn-helix domain-containing protein [Ilumatobacteraceae bacterium]
MPTTSRQAERSHRSSEALLDAAAELISEGGLGSMTFAAIGDRAGYSRGLVTARFGSKAGLVGALVRRVWGDCGGRVRCRWHTASTASTNWSG